MSKATAREGTDEARTKVGKLAHNNKPEARIVSLQPYRAVRKPANGMEINEPPPMHSNNKPRAASPKAIRSFAKGTRGAQTAHPNPATRKAYRVAARSRAPAGTRVDVSSNVMPVFYMRPRSKQSDNPALGVEADPLRGRAARQSGHRHDVAADHDDETRPCGQTYFADRNGVPYRGSEQGGVARK